MHSILCGLVVLVSEGLVTLPQGNQEPLVVKDKDGGPQVSFG